MPKLNGCHSLPRPTAQTMIPVQDGWCYVVDESTKAITRVAQVRMVPHAMTTACQYSRSTPDPACASCPNINIE